MANHLRTCNDLRTMKAQIKARGVKVAEALRAQVELRLGLALCRFGERIGRVTVDLSSIENQHSRANNRCQITVGLQSFLTVQVMDADLSEAAARAIARVSRRVALAIKLEPKRADILTSLMVAKKRRLRAASLPYAGQEAEKTRPSGLKRKSRSVRVRK